MLELSVSCINRFYKIVVKLTKLLTTAQAGGKKDARGYLEQLMINKMLLNEVIKHKIYFVMACLDYQKAFDYDVPFLEKCIFSGIRETF